jgi:hypothetical protein
LEAGLTVSMSRRVAPSMVAGALAVEIADKIGL